MYEEGDHKHYSVEEVEEIFRSEYEIGNWRVSYHEYLNLCKIIACMRKEHVDFLHGQIQLVVTSLERTVRMDAKTMPCAYINLRDQSFLERKKAVIVLSPYLLTSTYATIKLKKIQHEIAHHVLGHLMTVEDISERQKFEEEAESLALIWLNEEIHHLNSLSMRAGKKREAEKT